MSNTDLLRLKGTKLQIRIEQPGPPSMMELSIYTRPSHEAIQLQQQHHQQNQAFLQQFGDAGQQYWQQMQQHHHNFYVESGLQQVETLLDLGLMAEGEINRSHFPEMLNIESLQMAAPQYQEYLMSNPVVRQLWFDGRIEGYVDTYNNNFGMTIGLKHEPYREVVTTLGNWAYEDPEVHGYYYRECLRDPLDDIEDHRALRLKDKLNVVQAWHQQQVALLKNIDPTSVDGFEVREE